MKSRSSQIKDFSLGSVPEFKDFEEFGCGDPTIRPSGIQSQYRKIDPKTLEEEIQVFSKGSSSPFPDSTQIDQETISDIGSITKMYTAALLLKLWDNELTAGNSEHFPDGMETKLSHDPARYRKMYFTVIKGNKNIIKTEAKEQLMISIAEEVMLDPN